jgi:hypothetical protein
MFRLPKKQSFPSVVRFVDHINLMPFLPVVVSGGSDGSSSSGWQLYIGQRQEPVA